MFNTSGKEIKIEAIPDISVVIPAYNCSSTIARCIESVLRSECEAVVELIVVDDGSSDETLTVLRSIKDPRVLVIHTSNNGVSSARNTGLRLASGRYVTFIDADDYISTDYLEILLFHAQEGHDLVISEAFDVDADGAVIGGKTTRETASICVGDAYDFDAPYAHTTVWGCLYERGLIEGLAFPIDLSVGEDTLFFHKALLGARSPIHISFKGYYYVRSATSTMESRSAAGYYDEAIAWARVAELFDGNVKAGRQALSISVKHAAEGVLMAPHVGDAYVKLCKYLLSNAGPSVIESLRRCRYRRAALIFSAYFASKVGTALRAITRRSGRRGNTT